MIYHSDLEPTIEFIDFVKTSLCSSVMRILPRHLREVVSVLDISHLHQSLIGMSYTGANLAFMDVLKNWPLFGSTVYEVSVSFFHMLMLNKIINQICSLMRFLDKAWSVSLIYCIAL